MNLRSIPISLVRIARRIAIELHSCERSMNLSKEVREEAAFSLTQARQRMDSMLLELEPELRTQPTKRKELIDVLETLALQQQGEYAHPDFVRSDSNLCFRRLPPGTVVPHWQTLYLRSSSGPEFSQDTTRTLAEFIPQEGEDFTVPETTNNTYWAIEVWN